jgi:hypothetical protein
MMITKWNETSVHEQPITGITAAALGKVGSHQDLRSVLASSINPRAATAPRQLSIFPLEGGKQTRQDADPRARFSARPKMFQPGAPSTPFPKQRNVKANVPAGTFPSGVPPPPCKINLHVPTGTSGRFLHKQFS